MHLFGLLARRPGHAQLHEAERDAIHILLHKRHFPFMHIQELKMFLFYKAVLNTATTCISRHTFTDAYSFLEPNLKQPDLGQDISVMFLSNEYLKEITL